MFVSKYNIMNGWGGVGAVAQSTEGFFPKKSKKFKMPERNIKTVYSTELSF